MHDVRTFDRLAPLYDRVMPPADPETLQAGLAFARRPVERALDVGGGTGRGAQSLPVSDPVVVDASSSMLRQAHRRGLQCVQGDARRLPVADASVDAVVVVDALHHFRDVDGTIDEAARVLRPGGVFVVREFDPTTVRGWALAGVEHLAGFDSTFVSAAELGARCRRAGLEPHVPERGFEYTVAAVRPKSGEQ